MQPANDDESVKAAQHLRKTGIFLFDLSLQGARLKPIAFGSRSCNPNEKKSICLLEREHVIDGQSLRIGNIYGDATFIGFVTVPLLKIFSNTTATSP